VNRMRVLIEMFLMLGLLISVAVAGTRVWGWCGSGGSVPSGP
jgi:hypothetical protein